MNPLAEQFQPPSQPTQMAEGMGGPMTPDVQASTGMVSKQQQATPAEHKELQQAADLATKMLYDNEQSQAAIMKLLKRYEKDPRVGVYQATTMTIKQVDGKMNMGEAVLVEMIPTVADMVIELGVESGTFDMNEKEMMQSVGYATMGVMEEYGLDPEGGQEYMNSLSAQEQAELDTAAGVIA